jgi:arsenate reductase
MTTHVLILCTHNSARSVLAEGMLNHLAAKLGKDVRAHSAGSAPSGRINPFAIEALRNAGVDTGGYRSKSWDEFSLEDSPPLSIVITVCDSAAAEQCPVFFGGAGSQPVKVHLGLPGSVERGGRRRRQAPRVRAHTPSHRLSDAAAAGLAAREDEPPLAANRTCRNRPKLKSRYP